MSRFYGVPGSAAAVIDITKTGYTEYIETFTIANDTTKEITLSSGGLKFYVDVKDSIYGTYINGIGFGVKNTSSGVWRNTTGQNGALFVDATGTNYEYPLSIGQTVVVAASKVGYSSDSSSITLTQASPVQLVTLHLVNLSGSAPSAGNFTAVITVGDWTAPKEIAGASVTMNELGRMASTNAAGTAMFFNVPVGTYSLVVSAPGYQSVTSDITGASLETAMKRVNLLPTGFRQDGNGTIRDPDGNLYQPWNPNYGDGNGNYIPGGSTAYNQNTSAAAANDRAAAGITVFLDNIMGIGAFVFILLGIWFVKKIILT